QGRENAKEFLRQNKEVANEIEAAVRQRAMGGEIPLALGVDEGDDSQDEA
ncbi:MAG: DNA recombination/repair protein RecA, partial [Anaerolineaceae bacterium]|nr:DNA recombination/repair protein RecA [Anaerolineaceae bacterium]